MPKTPHTDLPWALDQNGTALEIIHEETAVAITGRIGLSRRNYQNLEFAVHAANVYPKLIAFLCSIDGKHASAAKRLLHEIGES